MNRAPCRGTVIEEKSVARQPEASPRVGALIQCMRQLRMLLANLTDQQYSQKPVGYFQSSLGSHVRHSLDHVRALLRARSEQFIDYDDRLRKTEIEFGRMAAISEILSFERDLGEVAEAELNRPLLIRAMLTGDGIAIDAQTSIGRELAFVVSHTIHHNALIGAMLHQFGVVPPADFGLAPSTVAYQVEAACVPSPSFH
ncbi:MAG: DinB family protein [Planctomycetes bacterium]|nr:DinB family protein [Planctomycetota bacterium]